MTSLVQDCVWLWVFYMKDIVKSESHYFLCSLRQLCNIISGITLFCVRFILCSWFLKLVNLLIAFFYNIIMLLIVKLLCTCTITCTYIKKGALHIQCIKNWIMKTWESTYYQLGLLVECDIYLITEMGFIRMLSC